MDQTAFGFALLAGVAMATYTIFLRLGSADVHPAAGAAVVTGVAFCVNLGIAVAMRAGGAPVTISTKSALLLAVVGAAAACADLFTLSAYVSGLKITSSFVISGTSIALVLLVGFVILKEPLTVGRLVAIGLIAAGVFLLQRAGV